MLNLSFLENFDPNKSIREASITFGRFMRDMKIKNKRKYWHKSYIKSLELLEDFEDDYISKEELITDLRKHLKSTDKQMMR